MAKITVSEVKNSPYWAARIHTRNHPETGHKVFSRLSTKVPVGKSDDYLQSKETAENIAVILQGEANARMISEGSYITQAHFTSVVQSLMDACGVTVEDKSPKWSEFAPKALERICKGKAPATANAYKGGHKSFTASLPSDLRITEIKVGHVQDWYDSHIERGGSAKTATKNLAPINLIFKSACNKELIPRNPCDNIEKEGKVSESYLPFTTDQLSAIFRALSERGDEIEYVDEWVVAITFATFTGAREGDCIGLNRSMISDDQKVVSYVEGKKLNRHKQGKIDGTISVKLSPALQKVLAKAQADDEGYFCPNLRKLNAGGTHGAGQRFKGILDLADVKITYREGLHKTPRTCFHSFRAMLKTELDADGVRRDTNHHLTGHKDDAVGAGYIEQRVDETYRECEDTFARLEAIIK